MSTKKPCTLYYLVWEYENKKGRMKAAVKVLGASSVANAIKKASKYIKKQAKSKKALALQLFVHSNAASRLADQVYCRPLPGDPDV